MYMDELHDLVNKVAPVLAGGPVIVRFQRPAVKEFDGIAVKIGGHNVIDIDPGLSEANMLYILCHEAAHIRLKHLEKLEAMSDLPNRVDPNAEPGSLSIGKQGMYLYKNSPGNKKIESEAESLAQKWLEFADEHKLKFSVHRSVVERKLLALTHWLPDEMRANINRTAARGAKEIIDVARWTREQEKISDDWVRRYKKNKGEK